MPHRNALQRQKERRAKLLPEMLAAMREPSDTRTVDRSWLRIALQYFHDLPARAAKNAGDDDVATDGDGITVRVKNQSYWSRGREVSGCTRVDLTSRGARRAKERTDGIMICARWCSGLSASAYAVLGRNPWLTERQRRYRQILRGDPCGDCGRPGGQVDHILPKADSNRGKEQNWHNLTAAGDECNNRMLDAPLLLWLANQEAPMTAWGCAAAPQVHAEADCDATCWAS